MDYEILKLPYGRKFIFIESRNAHWKKIVLLSFNPLSAKKQSTKFTSAKFQKLFKFNHIENSKTRGQTV